MFDGRRGHRGRATTRVMSEREIAALLAVAFEKGEMRVADGAHVVYLTGDVSDLRWSGDSGALLPMVRP
jgi:hypothetical protein